LKDESKRRAYDLIYPSITRSRPSPSTTCPPPSTPQSGVLSEALQIAVLCKSKQDRGVRWWTKKNAFDSSIFELQREIRQFEQQIKLLNSIVAAEAAEEAQKNSWRTWLLSPIYKKAEDSKEDKAYKDIKRQERRIEKDMKERRLRVKEEDLKTEERLLRKAKEEVDAADLVDDRKIQVIQDMIQARERRERQERDRVEIERIARIWKQEQEAAEALRKRQAEERAAAQKRREEQARKWQNVSEQSAYKASERLCGHDGWWPKVQGRTTCPECHDIWTYLLQCPGCKMKACPKCQHTIRPRRNHRASFRATSSSEDYSYDFF
jgi:hypothetical protein